MRVLIAVDFANGCRVEPFRAGALPVSSTPTDLDSQAALLWAVSSLVMAANSQDDADLSDEWIDREQPPTLKFLSVDSMSGSVNILSDTTQKWTNLEAVVAKDLLRKQTKPLTSLFEPPSPVRDGTTTPLHEGLSIVEEERSDEEQDLATRADYQQAWSNLRAESRTSNWSGGTDDKENSDTGTIRPSNTIRSADGLIPNFSFPRSGSTTMTAAQQSETVVTQTDGTVVRTIVETAPTETFQERRQISNAEPESELTSTPKKNTHKSSGSSISPTKSPLKLFHAEQDTFTRDHTARMIGMLSAVPAPAMQSLHTTVQHDTQKSHESEISDKTEITDSGPERKKVKTHEPKGSVTLQNFNDNADRLAAKLRAKGGGLGKGLPRVLEDTKIVLGRRISSAAERLDQQRKKDRNPKSSNLPRTSGFEAMNIPVDQFKREPKFGSRSTKSHFSDWESERDPESRQVSEATPLVSSSDEELAAQSIKPQTLYDSVRQTWTQTPGRITGRDRPSSAPTRNSPRQHVRSPSSASNSDARKSPRIKNFPPSAMETLRHGNMVFSTETQCWKHVDEGEDESDPFSDIGEIQSRGDAFARSGATLPEHDREADYPDEIELSSSSSYINQDYKSAEHGSMYQAEKIVAVDRSNSNFNQQFSSDESHEYEEPVSFVHHGLPPHVKRDNMIKVSQTIDEPYEDELANMTADMTMSQSTGHLVEAINTRYGAGPWEHVQSVDLSGLRLDSLFGLSKFFPALTVLDISNNSISSLDDLPSSLQVLKAQNNKLTAHRTNFTQLPNLERLYLDGNQFEDLDSLSPLSHLRHLQISNNHLECIEGLRNLPNLISLEAQGNLITRVDFAELQGYSGLSQLQSIDLASNRLERLSGLESLEGLMELDVSNNTLPHLEVSAAMPQLKVLKASENVLCDIDLTPFPKLRVVYLDDNELSRVSLPPCLKYIDSFSIRRQGQVELELDLTSLCEVKKLFLGGNALPGFRLDTTFHSLKYLELAGLQLRSLPEDFAQKVPNLRVLNLSNNDISSLTPLRDLERLERLMLPNNKVTMVKDLAETLATLPRLKALDVRANPYTSRFYAPIHASLDIDYFANLDGPRNADQVMRHWLGEDEKYLTTLSATIKARREAYGNLIWMVCRSLRWHDGRMLETQQLLQADAYVDSFAQDGTLSLAS